MEMPGKPLTAKMFHLLWNSFDTSWGTLATVFVFFSLEKNGANDYGRRYDDTSCYLLENIKFKLNYMRNYLGNRN